MDLLYTSFPLLMKQMSMGFNYQLSEKIHLHSQGQSYHREDHSDPQCQQITATRTYLQSRRHGYARLHQHSSSHHKKWSFGQALSTLPRPIQDHPSGTQNLELQVRTITQS